MANLNFFEKLKSVYIIAEAGVNHNGNINIAKDLIDKAKDVGADAVKFQSYKANKLANVNTPKVKYQKFNAINSDETHLEMLQKYEQEIGIKMDMFHIMEITIKLQAGFVWTNLW